MGIWGEDPLSLPWYRALASRDAKASHELRAKLWAEPCFYVCYKESSSGHGQHGRVGWQAHSAMKQKSTLSCFVMRRKQHNQRTMHLSQQGACLSPLNWCEQGPAWKVQEWVAGAWK
jgi:hypothetical protein